MTHYHRYVAIGDSSTEGMDDPDGNGGYHGWANRLAEHIAESQAANNQAPLLYANLGIRGRRTRRIREEQLQPALAMQPDLATLFSGTNDVVARHFDLCSVLSEIEIMQRALIESGATLLTFTLPDLSPIMPLARLVSGRLNAFNHGLRALCNDTGTILVDFAQHAVASDPRLWSEDRLHANSAGHARVAAALAHALNLPGTDGSWTEPLPSIADRSVLQRMRAEGDWTCQYFVPWVMRHMRGRSSGDNITAKRPELLPV